MRTENLSMPFYSPRVLQAITLTLLVATVECTVLLDRSSVQCQTDADCEHFGGHPYCRSSVCVRSYLQPNNCFLATSGRPPVAPSEFTNQCSLNYLPDSTGTTCLSFDTCGRVPTSCGKGGEAGIAGPPAPPAPEGGTPASADAGLVDPGMGPQTCEALAGGPVIYLTGSSNFPPLLRKLAPIIQDVTGLTPVFKTTDSCTGASSMYPDASGAFRPAHYINDPAPGGAYAQVYDAQGARNCTLGGRVEVDIGESEIYSDTCGLPKSDVTRVRELPGPILPILFVVPNVFNSESSISAEAAREVFGNGGHVAPWLNPSLLFIRGGGTATTRLVGLAIDVPVPAQKFWGIDQGTAEKLAANLSAVQDPSEARAAVGILGADYYDQNKLKLKALAFQAKSQSCAYLPDSSLNTRDKINVRDGHYPIWGLLHFFSALGPDGLPSDKSLAFLRQFAEPVSPEILDAFIDASWVPNCAMMVQRVAELGDLIAETPPHPCGCHFDVRVSPSGAKVPDGCKTCSSNNDCTDPRKPSCNFGYCEPSSR